ncbi:MAG: DMT family transporter [Gaiellaceae bacterium]
MLACVSGSGFAVSLALLAGLAGSIQIAVMGRFGDRIGSLEALAFSLVISTVIATVALVALRGSLDGFASGARQPPWLWIGGVMGVFIVGTITFAQPRIGTTATIGLLIAGQLAMGVVIDRFGLFGVERIDLTLPRLLGIALLAVGAALSLHRA